MAKSPDKTDKNAPDAAAAASADTAPTPRQIVVHAQYVKDLSFENPNAPEILIEPPTQPDVEIGVNVCLLYTSPSPRDATLSRMPSSA